MSAADFDIDVDLSEILDCEAPVLVNARYYEMAHRYKNRRQSFLQAKAWLILDNAILAAQWRAARQRLGSERRRAIRVPLLSRVHLDAGEHMVSTDISLAGMRCTGEPEAGSMDVEFKIPGLAFPIDARVEVTTFRPGNVTPLVGMRFTDMDDAYREHLVRYIGDKRQMAAAA